MHAPRFASGHMFMTGPLNRPEVEAVAPLVYAEIERVEAAGEDARHLRRALEKMDYALPPVSS